MIGSSTPGISADVLRADMAARQRQAEQRQETARLRRELRAAQRKAHRDLRAARNAVPRNLSQRLPRGIFTRRTGSRSKAPA